VGKRGLVYASISPLSDRYVAGYSHFDLFGKGWFFNLELNQTESERIESRGAQTKIDPQLGRALTLAAPVARNQWLRLGYEWSRLETDTRFQLPPSPLFPGGELRNLGVSTHETWDFSWERNTADDTFLPSLGDTLRIGWQRERQLLERTEFLTLPEITVTGEESDRFYLDAEQFITPRFRHTLFGRLRLDYRENEAEGRAASRFESRVGELELGYRFRPLTGQAARRFGDLYLGGSLDWRRLALQSETHFGGASDSRFERTSDLFQIEVFAAWRHRWGVVRANLRYVRSDDNERQDVP